MYQVGDTIVHPHHGAGVVTEIKELRFFGKNGKRYYSIQLMSEPGTTVMVPVRNADEVGLRPPITTAKLGRVWRRLRAQPEILPSDHNERYRLVREKLHDGDILQIAEVLRDLSWKDCQGRKLTSEGKRLYDKGMRLLASEIAAAQGSDLTAAQVSISRALDENVKSSN
jgi:CarD family transcriptional regulator